jgi:hypothetical protein
MNELPTSLVRFERQLERAIRLDRGRRRRRVAFRLAAVGVGALAIALGALSVLPGDGPGRSTVARAATALSPPGGKILHTVILTTENWPDGEVIASRSETWQQTSPPYDHRTVMGGRRQRELAMRDGRPESYDARTNTIYIVVPGTKLPPLERPVGSPEDRLLDDLRTFLRSGLAREDGRVNVRGRTAIRIVSVGSGSSLKRILVDAETYRPIESFSVSDEGVRVTSRYETYEELPATEANLALLSLRRQHRDAAVKPGITVEGFDGPKK